MRWIVKDEKVLEEPELGDIRIIKRFLLFPKCIGNEERWLETAWIKQKLIGVPWVQEMSGCQYTSDEWEDIAWSNEAERSLWRQERKATRNEAPKQ